ncbi:condensation domain-containing protein [Chitinophaga qingshengii]|uniref:KR domain-containing protein n=1 Tax=Chitinophaga qingshengii TaxID=1569794 RepID=A0ABR7TJM2_9BACT|nr:condensation domain-containing protein [Chitinophaga qingshengii]MBC9929259.1 KR domain-containing protein [Chitinophaga qingshengii]
MNNTKKIDTTAIAVVGMSCRFPGAASVDEFWRNLVSGKNTFTWFSREELEAAGISRELLDHPDYIRSIGGILEDKDKYDHYFFGHSPNEAYMTDPQVRVFLQEAWHALEDAGYPFNNATAQPVTGIYAGASNSFVWQAMALFSGKVADMGLFQSQLLANKDLLAVKTAFQLDLRGPAVTVNTACSTSLVAVHLACQALLNNECEVALGGGVSMSYNTIGGYLPQAGSIGSVTGIPKAFDQYADGIVAGEGVGVVVLKRLEDAVRDGNNIYAVIKGSAMNNDGRQKAGFSAPGVKGQAAVIKAAQQAAGITAEEMIFVETHGSATPLGDLIEMEALTQAFETERKAYCGIGAVKSNVGHADVAAGIAGFIKAVMAVKHRLIPPNLSFEVPNLQVDWVNSPFYVVTRPTDVHDDLPMYAGVSSFGIGGTNAHVIIGEAPALPLALPQAAAPQLFVFSAATKTALERYLHQFRSWLRDHPEADPMDVAYTLQIGRRSQAYRLAFMAEGIIGCLKQLEGEQHLVTAGANPELTLRLSESAQSSWSNHPWYLSQPLFKEMTEDLAGIFSTVMATEYPFLQNREREMIWQGLSGILLTYAETRFMMTLLAVPLTVITEGRTALLAPVLSASIDIRTALGIWITLFLAEMPSFLHKKPVGKVLERCEIDPVRVSVLCNFQPIPLQREDFMQETFWQTAMTPSSHKFWQPAAENATVLFLGGHDRKSIRVQAKDAHDMLTYPAAYDVLEVLSRLWQQGCHINWEVLYKSAGRRLVSLPGYVFDQHSFWMQQPKEYIVSAETKGVKETIDKWFYFPGWERSFIHPQAKSIAGTVVVFLLPGLINSAWFRAFVAAAPEKVIGVCPAKTYSRASSDLYYLDPAQRPHYDMLLNDLAVEGHSPQLIVHAWNLVKTVPELTAVKDMLPQGFFSLIYLCQSLAARTLPYRPQLKVLTQGLYQITGAESLQPTGGFAAGILLVARQEIPSLDCIHIDLEKIPGNQVRENEALNNELLHTGKDKQVAYRRGLRWEANYRPLSLSSGEQLPAMLQHGTYLLIGGLGKIGYLVADYLATNLRARLILVGREFLGDPDTWHNLSPESSVGRKVAMVKRLREKGSEVMYYSLEMDDVAQWKNILKAAGPLRGVFHMAGETRNDILQQQLQTLTPESIYPQFLPKVFGVTALFKALQEYSPGFVVLTSSLSSVLGGLGFSSYVAANSFMDAFVHYANMKMPETRWLSVNTAEWLFEAGPDFQHDERTRLFMTPKEGLQSFCSILDNCLLQQVVISTTPLQERIKKWVTLETDEPGPDVHSPSSVITRPAIHTTYAAPVTPAEKEVAAVWSRILGYEQIGVDDNFFELGGDSLKVIMVAANIHKRLKVQIPVATFFRIPTIRQLAHLITDAERKDYLAVVPAEDQYYYPVTAAQRRLFILQQIEPDSTGYNECSLYQLGGDVNEAMLNEAFHKLIQRHDSLRTSFHMPGDDPVLVVHDEVDFQIHHFDCLNDDNPALQFIRPFDITQAPLMRVALANTSAGNKLLMIDFHHLITDGISSQIIIKELVRLYAGDELEQPYLQYKDFALWQQLPEVRQMLAAQERYWLQQFREPLPLLDLPTDFARPLHQTFEGSTCRFILDGETAENIRALAAREEATSNMVLLAVCYIWLAKLSGQQDLVVGTPVAGRSNADLEEIVGMFINTLPLRMQINANETPAEVIKRVKRITLDAFDNQDYPFEMLVEKVAGKRDLGRNPVFDVMFLFQNYIRSMGDETQMLKDRDIEINIGGYEKKTVKFDLSLEVVDDGNAYHVSIHYATRLFTNTTIEYWAAFFTELAAAIPRYTDIAVSQLLPLSQPVVRRHVLPDGEINSTLSTGSIPVMDSQKQSLLLDIWKTVLGKEEIGIHDSFFHLGGDSLKVLRMIAKLNQAGYHTAVRNVFNHDTVAMLAGIIDTKQRRQVPVASDDGRIPLTPIQYWFFENYHTDQHQFNTALMFATAEDLPLEGLEAIFNAMFNHHATLRSTFPMNEKGVRFQQIDNSGEPLLIRDFDLRESAAPVNELQRLVAGLQQHTTLELGPLFTVCRFRFPDRDRILVLIHHLLMDGFSWRLLMEDFQTLYAAYMEGSQLMLPEQSDSYGDWSHRLSTYTSLDTWEEERILWENMLAKPFDLLQSPAGKRFSEQEIRMEAVHLDESETNALITDLGTQFGCGPDEMIISIVTRALYKWKEMREILIAMEGHGRESPWEDMNVSRTVGWFANMYPVNITVKEEEDALLHLQEVRRLIRTIPNKGIGYGIFRYLQHPNDDKWKTDPQITVSYLGQFDEIETQNQVELSFENYGEILSRNIERPYLLKVSGIVIRGRLQLSVFYPYEIFSVEEIMDLLHLIKNEVAHYCLLRNQLQTI